MPSLPEIHFNPTEGTWTKLLGRGRCCIYRGKSKDPHALNPNFWTKFVPVDGGGVNMPTIPN